MRSKTEKGGTPSPLTLKKYIEEKTELIINEISDIQTDLIRGVFDDEILPEMHDRVSFLNGQLNLIREIKFICNNRGRY